MNLIPKNNHVFSITLYNSKDAIIVSVKQNTGYFKQRALMKPKGLKPNTFANYVSENPLPVLVFDQESEEILEVNEAACKLFGFSPAELPKLQLSDLIDRQHKHQWGAPQTGQCLHRKNDGRVSEIEYSTNPINYKGRSAVLSILRDITTTRTTERTLYETSQRRTQELELLGRVNAALRTAKNRQEMLPIILDQIISIFGVRGAAIITSNLEDDDLEIELGYGSWDFWTGRRALKDGITKKVIKSGQSYISENTRNDPNLSQQDLIANLSSVLCLPLETDQQVVGVLWVGKDQPFSEFQQHLLAAIANTAANALQRSKMHEHTQKHAHQVATVNEIGRTLAQMQATEKMFPHLARSICVLIPDIWGVIVYQ
ncbi:MAG: GAF domain-containing protein, partial [Anaerolineales bacterium]|nr:GAF domain-containing protein [Anaerolineales bacterium]